MSLDEITNLPFKINTNVFKIGPLIELKKLLIHDSLVKSTIKSIMSFIKILKINK